MPFAAAYSTKTDSTSAAREASSAARDTMNCPADLAIAFFSPNHASQADEISAAIRGVTESALSIGVVAESLVANDREIEDEPAIVVWLARWKSGVAQTPFHLTLEDTPEGHSLLGWPDEFNEVDPVTSAVVVFGDPFSFPVDGFLRQANEGHPGMRVMGGMASGVRAPGECRLLLADAVQEHGAVGVLLQDIQGVRSIVSQGCRPIGRHLVVTRGHDNVIAELGGKPPLHYLQHLWEELSTTDRQLLQRGLHIGRVMNEYQGEFSRGDFLIRNVLGIDNDSGALAINDRVRVGQTVQFHVRDAASADEDLRALLQQSLASSPSQPRGGLLFTCNGRGTRLFDKPHHDAQAIRAELPSLPLAGFFAQGEIGPVGAQNFIHGFTASVVLFED
jgi:small ligand-binding sensory domain FIST